MYLCLNSVDQKTEVGWAPLEMLTGYIYITTSISTTFGNESGSCTSL